MARELYNWDQGRGYSIIAIYNTLEKSELSNKTKKMILENFINELNSLQTMYGKEGIVGLANRYLKKIKD